MQRPEFPNQTDILIIVDYPTLGEVQSDVPFSASSHLEILSDLQKVGVKQLINIGTKEEIVLKRQISTTYLSYERPDKSKPDFQGDFIRPTKKMPAGNGFTKVDGEKNLYISDKLLSEVNALVEEIRQINPKLIICAGKWALYFLSGRVPYKNTRSTLKDKKPLGGLHSHRGSLTALDSKWNLPEIILYPILPTTEKWRTNDETKRRTQTEKYFTFCSWDMQFFAELFNEICRKGAAPSEFLYPKRSYIFGTSLDIVRNGLRELATTLEIEETFISVDIETRHGTIDCIGLSWKDDEGICIPFSTLEDPNFWTVEEELEIVNSLGKVLRHDNARIIGQNFSYDSQYIWHFLLIELQSFHDTMISGHVLHNTLKKDLATLASINLLSYTYWKSDQVHTNKVDA